MKHKTRILDLFPIILLATSLSVIILLGSFFFHKFEKQLLIKEKQDDLEAIADLKVNQIVQYLKERYSNARIFYRNPMISEGIEEWLNQKEDEKSRNNLIHRLDASCVNYGFKNLFLTSPEGELLLSVNPSFLLIDPSTISVIHQAAQIKKIVFTDLYFSALNQYSCIDWMVPIMNDRDMVFAVLILRIDPEEFLMPSIQSWPIPSETAETILVGKENDHYVFYNPFRHIQSPLTTLKLALTEQQESALNIPLNNRGIYKGKDYRGVKVLAKLRQIPDTKWFIITKIDEEEILSEGNLLSAIIVLCTIILIILSWLSIVWIYHLKQRNIFRRLYLIEKDLSEKKEEFQQILHSLGDAVITTDRNGMILMMNPVAEKLTGWNHTEVKGLHISKVFVILNEDTRMKVQNPVEKVLEGEIIIGLANHTVLMTKDGKELHIAGSGAPIRNDLGEIIGVVLAFRDQTEERKLKRQLLESEEKFRSIFENNASAMAIIEPDTTISLVNDAYRQISGYTEEEVTGMSWTKQVHPDDLERLKEYNRRRLMNPKDAPDKYEFKFFRQDGKVRNAFISISMIKNTQKIIASFVDITDQKIAERDLKLSEERFYKAFHNSPDIIIITSIADGKIQEANETFFRTSGFSKSESYGKTTIELNLWSNVTDRNEFIWKMLNEGKVLNYEAKFLTKSGESLTGLVSGEIFDLQGMTCILSVIHDITKRKQTEETLFKLSSRYEALLDSVPFIIMEVDTTKVYTWANKAGYVFFGNDVIGKAASVYFEGEQNTYEVVQPIFNGKTDMVYVESWQRRQDGEKRLLAWRCRVLKDAQGNVKGVLSSAEDITERKRAEEQILSSEEKYRRIFENVQDVYYETSTDGLILEVSPSIEVISKGQYRCNDLHGKSMYDFYSDPEQLSRFLSVIKEREKVFDFEISLKNKDGSIIPCSISAKLWYNDQGQPEKIIGSLRDITDRKLTEDALVEAKNRFEHISSSISDISFSCIADSSGNYRLDWIYGATEKITGYRIDELITMGCWDNIVMEDDLPLFKKHILDLRPGSSDTCRLRMKHKKGSIIWIEASAECVRKENGANKTLLYGGLVDITSDIQYVRELRESELKFRSLVENAFDGIYLTNGRYFIYVNKRFCELMGYSQEELTSPDFDFAITLPEKSRKEVQTRTKLRKQGKEIPSIYEFQIITKEGLPKDVEVSTVDVSNQDQFVILGIVRDISERKKMEGQMIQSSRLTALGEMAAGIAHEINQPLNTLSLAFDNILFAAQENPFVDSQYLNSKSEKINESILRIRNIIDHIRAFSRDHDKYFLSAFNINESIHNAISLVSEQFKIHKINLITHLDESIPVITGNTFKVEQVILNLLSNSKDALMEKRDKIRNDYPMYVRISSGRDKDQIVVEVEDNGIGIRPEDMDKAMLPFYTSKAPGKGTGLGLSISYGIIQDMNGTIEIRSEILKGTTISLRIPYSFDNG